MNEIDALYRCTVERQVHSPKKKERRKEKKKEKEEKGKIDKEREHVFWRILENNIPLHELT